MEILGLYIFMFAPNRACNEIRDNHLYVTDIDLAIGVYDLHMCYLWHTFPGLCHWSPTVPVSVWLPEPARDRGSKQETLNDDFYHTTSRSAAIFGVQGGRSYLVLALTLWIGLCPMKRSSGVWNFGDVSVTYRRSFGNHTLAGPYVPVTYYRNRL